MGLFFDLKNQKSYFFITFVKEISKNKVMDTAIKGVTFESDKTGKKRYVRFDLQHYEEFLKPLFKQLGIQQKPEDWDEALSPEEFLTEAKKMLRQKFDERSKVS